MNVVVTGAAGFIGSATCRALLQQGHRVTGIDNFIDGVYAGTQKVAQSVDIRDHGRMSWVTADLRVEPIDQWLQGADVLINLAAMPGLDLSWSDFNLYASCNMGIVSNLLASLRLHPEVHLIHVSTSSVYGTESVGDEETPLNPVSPYGITKLAAEHLVRAYRLSFGIKATVLRLFSVYGPGQRPDMAYAKFCQLLLAGEVINITGSGQASRTNTYITDVTDALIRCCNIRPDGETMNICGDEEITVLQAVNVLAAALGTQARVNFVDPRPGDQFRTHGDHSAATQLLGWAPQQSITTGLERQALSAKTGVM